MAKEKMVTRTIVTTKAVVLCMDLQNGESYNDVITLPRTYKDEKEILKVLAKTYDTDDHRAVHVVSTEIVEELYGMPETEFVERAKVLPARTLKVEE